MDYSNMAIKRQPYQKGHIICSEDMMLTSAYHYKSTIFKFL